MTAPCQACAPGETVECGDCGRTWPIPPPTPGCDRANHAIVLGARGVWCSKCKHFYGLKAPWPPPTFDWADAWSRANREKP